MQSGQRVRLVYLKIAVRIAIFFLWVFIADGTPHPVMVMSIEVLMEVYRRSPQSHRVID